LRLVCTHSTLLPIKSLPCQLGIIVQNNRPREIKAVVACLDHIMGERILGNVNMLALRRLGCIQHFVSKNAKHGLQRSLCVRNRPFEAKDPGVGGLDVRGNQPLLPALRSRLAQILGHGAPDSRGSTTSR
jgi:hypothetical protein